MTDKLDYGLASPSQIAEDLGVRAARARLSRNITQQDLANQAGIATRTVSRFERGEGASLDTLIRILQALDLAGHLVALLPDAGINPMATVSGKQRRERRRARPKPEDDGGVWSWDDEEAP